MSSFFPLSTVIKILQNKGAQNTDDVNQHYSNGQLWTGNYRLHTLVALRSRFQPLKLSSFFILTTETFFHELWIERTEQPFFFLEQPAKE